MLHERDIICISSIDWDFIWQSHQEIMSTLAENGNRVLFIENTGVRSPAIKDLPRLWKRFVNWRRGFRGIRKEGENLYIYSPLVLPFPYSKIATKINRFIMLSVIKRWMKVLEFHNPIVWSFLPTALTLNLLNELDPVMLIYYCVDDLASSSKGARKIKDVEEKVIKQADLVFATSHKLFRHCYALNERTHRFPCGVNVSDYNDVRAKATIIPGEMDFIAKAKVGYIGGIHKWVDVQLIKKIALKVKEKHIFIFLIGPVQTDVSTLRKIDNIKFLDEKNRKDLPLYVKYFDVGIIPYRKTEYTENVYPSKINEYLAMGKAVIATKIPEVVEFEREYGSGCVYFADNETDFDNIINEALAAKSDEIKKKRIAVANSNSWAMKIESMCDLINTRLKALENQVNKDWLSRFKKFYVTSRRKTVKIAAPIVILCFIVFYSPMVWFLASPLKISQTPQKADAIVVFGGGVGEKGSPGKSTLERARFSVDLYKEGFAKEIIYSSGYTFKYNDAENMKLFAMSMGVPENNIILDKEGEFTYENVKFTSKIAREKGFYKIILVTSPYNMQRAHLVFKSIARDINVIYVPVPDPQFYYRRTPVKLEQIRGILHEYLGILYYIFKGYIKL